MSMWYHPKVFGIIIILAWFIFALLAGLFGDVTLREVINGLAN